MHSSQVQGNSPNGLLPRMTLRSLWTSGPKVEWVKALETCKKSLPPIDHCDDDRHELQLGRML